MTIGVTDRPREPAMWKDIDMTLGCNPDMYPTRVAQTLTFGRQWQLEGHILCWWQTKELEIPKIWNQMRNFSFLRHVCTRMYTWISQLDGTFLFCKSVCTSCSFCELSKDSLLIRYDWKRPWDMFLWWNVHLARLFRSLYTFKMYTWDAIGYFFQCVSRFMFSFQLRGVANVGIVSWVLLVLTLPGFLCIQNDPIFYERGWLCPYFRPFVHHAVCVCVQKTLAVIAMFVLLRLFWLWTGRVSVSMTCVRSCGYRIL